MNEAAAAAPAPNPADAVPPATSTTPSKPKPKPTPQPPKSADAGPPPSSDAAVEAAAATDPGEDAYSNGYHLWEAGKYDEAISALRSFVSAYPKHKRVSYANNLIGRALLDKGDAHAAATALLSNYRNNPAGERAPDSLFYLGQALMKLASRSRLARPMASSTPSMARG